MAHLSRTAALFAGFLLIAPGLAAADDAILRPEAARDVKAISRDAAQKVQPDLTKEAPQVPQATRKIAPANNKSIDGLAPKKGQLQKPVERKLR